MSAGALLACLAFGRAAEAVTINTYAFFQEGYVGNSPDHPTSALQGTFTGAIDSNGYITQNTLTAFSFDFQLDTVLDGTPVRRHLYSGGIQNFSFLPTAVDIATGVTSALAIHAYVSPIPTPVNAGQLCVGLYNAFICGNSALGSLQVNTTNNLVFETSSLPTVFLIESYTQPDPPPVAQTPISASLLLFATALSGLGALGARRRRAAAKDLAIPREKLNVHGGAARSAIRSARRALASSSAPAGSSARSRR